MSIVVVLVALGLFLAAPLAIEKGDDGRRPLISAFTVIWLSFGVYLVLPAITGLFNGFAYFWAPQYGGEDAFTAAVGLGDLAFGSFLAGNRAWRRGRSRSDLQAPVPDTSRRLHRMTVTCGVLVVLGLMLKAWFLITSGGFEAVVLRMGSGAQRVSGLSDLEANALSVRALSGIADAGATVLLVEAIRRRRSIALPALIFIVVVTLSFAVTGKRLVVLLPILSVVIAVTAFRRRVTLSMAPVGLAVLLLAGMASLFYRIFVPATSAGISIDVNQLDYAQGSTVLFYLNSLEFSTVEMTSVCIQSPDDVLQLLGGRLNALYATNIEPFSYVVPRAFWPGKPELLVDPSYAVNSVLTGVPVGQGSGWAPTLMGTSYLFFGVIGTFVVFAILGVLVRFLDLRRPTRCWSPVHVVFYAWVLQTLFHFFRQGALGFTFVIGTVQQVGFILGALVLAAVWSTDASNTAGGSPRGRSYRPAHSLAGAEL